MRRGASRAGRARTLLGLAILLAAGLAGLGAALLRGGEELALEGAARPTSLVARPAGPGSEESAPVSGAAPRTALAAASVTDAAARQDAARTWSGQVRERGSGRPLAGARVTLSAADLDVAADTDAAGRFTLAWPLGAPGPAAEATHPGHAPARRPRVELDRPGRFELDATGTLAGTVRGPRADQARVLVWELGRARGERDEPLEAPVASDGSFELAGLVPGEYSVTAAAPGCAPTSESRVLVRAGARRELRLSLEPGVRLRGVVRLEASGEPVAGARLDLRAERQGLWRELERSAELRVETGADGRFEVAGLPAGTLELVVRAPWGGREELELDVPARADLLEHEITLARPAGLAGRVVDRRGSVVSDAWVLVQWGGRSLAFELLARADLPGGVLRTRTDAAGRFAFDELPAGRDLQLLASDARVDATAGRGWAHGLRLGSGERREELELRLRAAATVTGRVIGDDGAPLASARVRALRREGRTWLRCGEVRTGSDGAFSLDGLPPGPYLVDARLDGHERGRERVELSEGGEVALELQLAPAPSVWGRVVDGDGYGVPFARVRALPRDARGEEDDSRRSRSAEADAYGFFEVEDLESGAYRFTGRATGFEARGPAPLVLVPGTAELELLLARTLVRERAVLRGEVTLEGGAPIQDLRFEGLRGGAVERSGDRFRISGVAPGRVVLRVRAEGAVEQRLAPLDVPPGAELDLGLVRLEPGARVVVTVRDANGAAVRGARVRLVPLPPERGGPGPGARAVRPREQRGGRYVAEGVPRAGYRLRVTRRGYVGARRELELAERASRSARVVLQEREEGR